jgi:tetratricopeptide (TPR) repeat protein
LTPDLSILWPRLIGSAFSFGEAALSAQPVLSWQITVVGDPLYRPFGRLQPGEHIGTRFSTLHQALSEQNSPWLAWSYLQVVNFRLTLGEPSASLIAELQADPLARQSSILQEKLGDLFSASGRLSNAIRAYEQALTLHPSPQQQTRLTLTLADLLALFAREPQALALYQSFLDSFPDYPAPLAIYRKMLPLAQSLDQTDEIRRIQTAIDQLAPPQPEP